MKQIYSKTIEKSSGFMFARWSAGAKAYEYTLPPAERVIEDPLAPYYAGQVGMKMVGTMEAINPSIRKAIALRARYMDDFARCCINEGYHQVVLIGAGYDSRYARLQEFQRAQIYEVDLDSTQVIKKSLTRRLMGYLPANVKYISADLSRDSITDRLLDSGFSPDRKTLFIWEGVTLFLNNDIVAEILGRLAALSRDSRITFDFVPPELVDDETDYQGNRKLLEMCASIKEPLTFGCEPARMRDILNISGYHGIEIVSMRDVNQRYLGRSDIEEVYYFATAATQAVASQALSIGRTEAGGNGAGLDT
jgi:methyltransferase (TIGR00027 family)